MTAALFETVSLGAIDCANRICMAPMTRDRAGSGDVPTEAMVEYYRQRASAGLIVVEGTQPCAEGKGYWRTPGLYTAEQIKGWSRVTEAVHREGGRIVVQLMHCGRVVVPENRGYDADIVAPSALPCPAKVPGPDGVPVPTGTPRALQVHEIETVTEQFAYAASNAHKAGFDGVELHCASGYLVNQFLNQASNQRNDSYGGAIENRIRFPVEVLQAMANAIGADRIGFRISPGNPYNGMDTSTPEADFAPLLAAADGLGLAYVHVIDMHLDALDTLAMVRANWSGPIIANNELTAHTASELIASGRAEAVSFGRAFIANPDLPRRIAENASFAKPDYSLLYTGEERGYTDYPMVQESG